MYPLGLGPAREDALYEALTGPVRHVLYEARLYTFDEQPLATDLRVETGEIVVDWTNRRDEPTRTAHITVIDPDRQLVIDPRSASTSTEYLSRLLKCQWRVWLRAFDEWVTIPVFFGPVFEMQRYGLEVDIEAAGKEMQHLPPFDFPHGISIRKFTKYQRAIRKILEDRDETKFDFVIVHRSLPKNRSWRMGQSPWKACQRFADEIDKQLFYRADGTCTLRKREDTAVWKFTEGRDSVVTDHPTERISIMNVINRLVIRGEKSVKAQIKTETELTEEIKTQAQLDSKEIKIKDATDFADGRTVLVGSGSDPEERTIADSYVQGEKTVPLKKKLDRVHKKGAKVVVKFQGRKTVSVVASAKLPSSHFLSAERLTGGKRPMLRILDLPRIHRKKTAQERAEKELDDVMKGIEDDVSLSTRCIPHLEEGDAYLVEIDGRLRRQRAKRFTIPMDGEADQEHNWTGRRVPRRKHRGKDKKKRRRLRR